MVTWEKREEMLLENGDVCCLQRITLFLVFLNPMLKFLKFPNLKKESSRMQQNAQHPNAMLNMANDSI